MAEITASLVKELRERTGAGMMDCKKALTEANGDIELAIENMRKSGAIKAAKKAGNVAADGVIITKIDGTYGSFWKLTARLTSLLKMVVSRHLLTKYWTQLLLVKSPTLKF
jgi:translation elongation factor Ts